MPTTPHISLLDLQPTSRVQRSLPIDNSSSDETPNAPTRGHLKSSPSHTHQRHPTAFATSGSPANHVCRVCHPHAHIPSVSQTVALQGQNQNGKKSLNPKLVDSLAVEISTFW